MGHVRHDANTTLCLKHTRRLTQQWAWCQWQTLSIPLAVCVCVWTELNIAFTWWWWHLHIKCHTLKYRLLYIPKHVSTWLFKSSNVSNWALKGNDRLSRYVSESVTEMAESEVFAFFWVAYKSPPQQTALSPVTWQVPTATGGRLTRVKTLHVRDIWSQSSISF